MSRNKSLYFLIVACLLLPATVHVSAQDKSKTIQDRIKNAAANANKQQKYNLSYRLAKGQEIRWEIEQTATTKLQASDLAEESSSRSLCVKHWQVANVDSVGNMTFVHSFESCNMWSKTGEAEPQTYDSTSGNDPTGDYVETAKSIGIPLASLTINKQGQIIDRKSNHPDLNFLGDPIIPMPGKPISIGESWLVKKKLTAKDENGVRKQINAQVRYVLSKVKMPHAYISFQMEILTPIKSETIRSQIMQKVSKGYLVFDIKRGIPILREAKWDEKAHGFQGADSFLSYVGKMKEKYIPKNSRKQSSTAKKASAKVAKVKKSSDSKPRLRK